MSSSLAIIGTAGRKQDAQILAKDPVFYYETMLRACNKVIEMTGADTLVSGGAAFADHCAVSIFLQRQSEIKLILEIPAPLQEHGSRLFYKEHGFRSPGATANYYHSTFTKMLQIRYGLNWSSFFDLKEASEIQNIEINTTLGFKERNTKVANRATHCLAMTFGNGRCLKDGGTKDTMQKFLNKPNHGRSFHLDLNTLKLFEGAVI